MAQDSSLRSDSSYQDFEMESALQLFKFGAGESTDITTSLYPEINPGAGESTDITTSLYPEINPVAGARQPADLTTLVYPQSGATGNYTQAPRAGVSRESRRDYERREESRGPDGQSTITVIRESTVVTEYGDQPSRDQPANMGGMFETPTDERDHSNSSGYSSHTDMNGPTGTEQRPLTSPLFEGANGGISDATQELLEKSTQTTQTTASALVPDIIQPKRITTCFKGISCMEPNKKYFGENTVKCAGIRWRLLAMQKVRDGEICLALYLNAGQNTFEPGEKYKVDYDIILLNPVRGKIGNITSRGRDRPVPDAREGYVCYSWGSHAVVPFRLLTSPTSEFVSRDSIMVHCEFSATRC